MPIAIDYALRGPRTAPAVIRGESELLGFAVADGTGPPRIITHNLAAELSQLGDQPRVYFDAVLGKVIETCNELPVVDSFEDVRVMLHLLEQAIPPELAGGAVTGDSLRDACLRAQQIHHLHSALQHRLRGTADEHAYRNIELPAVMPTAVMILTGVRIDVPHLEHLQDVHAGRLDEARQHLHESVGRVVNCRWDQDMRRCLFEELGLPVYSLTEKDNPSVSDRHLEMLRELHPAPGLILQCRRLANLHSQAGDLLQHARYGASLVHADLDPLGAVTGRYACSAPNLQGLPLELRDGIVASPEQVLLEADLLQTELRVLAHFSQDRAMLAAFTDNVDIHRRTAAAALGKPEDQVTAVERELGKTLNFQIVFGAGADGVADTLQVAPDQAHQLLSAYHGYYSDVSNWIRAVHDRASVVGYVETFFGRRRNLPNLCNPTTASHGRRQAVNTIVQGTAAEIMKWMLARLLDTLPSDISLLLTVHDSVLLEVPESRVNESAALVHSVMSQSPEGFTVPYAVKIKVGPRWGSMRECQPPITPTAA